MTQSKQARKATYNGPEYMGHAHKTRYRHGKPIPCRAEDSKPYRNKHAECLPGQFSIRERLGLTFQQARDFARSFRVERAA